MSFESEVELLKRWTSLMLETDPDVITGVSEGVSV
jgi:DNA polymerase elongation subunit (family B)